MVVVYIVTTVFVMVLLLSIPLFPFWKVWERMKTHHPDIWQSAGPFEPGDMIASPGLLGIFLQVIVRMENDKALFERDPVIVKWVRISMEIVRMLPRTLMSQAGYFALFLYFTEVLVKLLLGPLA